MGADVDEGDAKLALGYTGAATRGTDYKLTPVNLVRNNDIVIRKSGTTLPNGCSASGEAVTCTVTLTVQDDNLFEGGSGKTESVKIGLTGSFNDGIGSAKSLDLTIEDNDPQPMFSIANVEGPENGNLTFTVTRDGAKGNDVSVTAKTGNHASASAENRATEGTDYTTKTRKLNSSPGRRHQRRLSWSL